eukprot:TRINITY_DN7243_c0_g2_i7.p1 TRINITY_DN7243_c0_g2~~TRINITY_DN7243_c0_g2_i7.p1  ORF type:complete len:364 (-),score=77.25 TRINITY_DN7243_c0_g2_i7:391-1482(-)
MEEDSLELNLEVYELLIIYHTAAHVINLQEIRKLLYKMSCANLVPTKVMFHHLLRCFVKHSPEHVNVVLKAMAKTKVAPDHVTYGLLLSVERDFNYVEEVTRTMKEYGVVPGVQFYVQYIRLALKFGEDLKAAEAIKEMQEANLNINSDVLILMLNRMIERKAISSALEVIDKLLATPENKSVTQYSVKRIVRDLIEARNYSVAIELFYATRNSGINYHPYDCAILLKKNVKSSFDKRKWVELFMLADSITPLESPVLPRLYQSCLACVEEIPFTAVEKWRWEKLKRNLMAETVSEKSRENLRAFLQFAGQRLGDIEKLREYERANEGFSSRKRVYTKETKGIYKVQTLLKKRKIAGKKQHHL